MNPPFEIPRSWQRQLFRQPTAQLVGDAINGVCGLIRNSGLLDPAASVWRRKAWQNPTTTALLEMKQHVQTLLQQQVPKPGVYAEVLKEQLTALPRLAYRINRRDKLLAHLQAHPPPAREPSPVAAPPTAAPPMPAAAALNRALEEAVDNLMWLNKSTLGPLDRFEELAYQNLSPAERWSFLDRRLGDVVVVAEENARGQFTGWRILNRKEGTITRLHGSLNPPEGPN